MQKLNITQLTELKYAIDEVHGFLTDNSCSDPDCCGGPFYLREHFEEAEIVLRKFGIEIEE